MVRSLALVGSCLGTFPPYIAHVLFFHISYYSYTINLVSASSSYYFQTCYSHARGILCGIHTSCMGSPFPIVHAECLCISVLEQLCND